MELTTYSEEVFSISRLFSSNTFPLEKLQNASFDSNAPPAFSVLGRHSRLAPAPESRRKRSVTKTLCHDGGEVWMKVLRKGVFKRVWKGGSWSRIPVPFSRESRIPHVFHQFPESRFSFTEKYIKKSNFYKS